MMYKITIATLLLIQSFGLPLGHGKNRSEPDQDLSQKYLLSPVLLRQELLRDCANGLLNSDLVRKLILETGDYSFDGLLNQHPNFRNLIQSQNLARKKWKNGKLDEAFERFLKTARDLADIGSITEAAFCYFLAAEICAEQENYHMCLRYLASASDIIEFGSFPYFEAHYFESLGYALWFLDVLPDSIRAFSEAAKRWKKIRFLPGLAACWNNIASLYEELQLMEQAESCYEKALQKALSTNLQLLGLSEIEHQIRINYALLAKKTGNTDLALGLLNDYKGPEIFELQLAKAEIFDDLDRCTSLKPEKPSQIIEKELLRARILVDRRLFKEAEQAAREALETTQESQLAYYQRKCVNQLGKVLELQNRYQDAITLYSLPFKNGSHISQPSFPFKRIDLTSLDGWIRCLVRLKRASQARKLINHLGNYRRRKDHRKLFGLDRYRISETSEQPLDQFTGTHPNPVPEKELSIVELWPDGNSIYTWIEDHEKTSFFELTLPEPVRGLILKTLSPFYQAEKALPGEPNHQMIELLQQKLLHPLTNQIKTQRVLLIPHKILQAFPIELLLPVCQLNEANEWIVSYLPAYDQTFQPKETMEGPPIIFTTRDFSERKGALRELQFFERHFAGIDSFSDLTNLKTNNARWIHFSSHLEWNPFFWKASLLGSKQDGVELKDILQKKLPCSLLSLGVCDAGNGFDGITPYWLGLSEAFLLNGANSLLVSRWKLDEFSSALYLGFFRRVREGMPMDLALHEARKEFQGSTLVRGSLKQSAQHPFFWAGVSYIGWPNQRLYPARKNNLKLFTFISAIVLCLVLIQVNLRNRR